jgi:hypothetical protein
VKKVKMHILISLNTTMEKKICPSVHWIYIMAGKEKKILA